MALNGYETDLNNIHNSVYRVKIGGTNDYMRIHFETSSLMIYDATELNTPNKVVRRSPRGDISVQGINTVSAAVSGGLNCTGQLTVRKVGPTGQAALITTSGTPTTLGGTLSVAQAATLSNSLSVAGISTFKGKTTHENGAELQGLVEIKSGTGADGKPAVGQLNVYGGTITSENGFGTGGTVTAGGDITTGGSLRVVEDASISGQLTVADSATVNGVLTIGGLVLKNQTENAVVKGLNADLVDGCNVNDTSTNVSSKTLWTSAKIDATKADKAIQIIGGTGLSGSGTLSGNVTLSHATQEEVTPSLSASSSSINQVISSITISNYGHVTAVTKTDLDKRYPTIDKVSEDIANANLTVTRDLIAKNPTDRKTNGNTLVMQNFTIQYGSNSIDFVFA